MRSVETEAGSIDEAIERALEVLRVERDQVEVEILENSARGLLGLGSRKARIRATVRSSLASKLESVVDASPTSDVSRETPPLQEGVDGAAARDGAVRVGTARDGAVHPALRPGGSTMPHSAGTRVARAAARGAAEQGGRGCGNPADLRAKLRVEHVEHLPLVDKHVKPGCSGGQVADVLSRTLKMSHL